MKILLVDDEFLARNAVLMLLARPCFAPCTAREAVNGQEAIDMIAQDAPDVALIDVSMPVKNGLELLAWIQQNAPQVYCVMLSSYSDFEYVRDAMKLGARDYLLKHQMTEAGLLEVLRQSGRMQHTQQAPAGDRERALLAHLLDARGGQDMDWARDCLFCVAQVRLTGERQGAHMQSLHETSKHILAEDGAVVALMQEGVLAIAFVRQARETLPQHKKRVLAAQKTLRGATARYHNARMELCEPVHCPTPAELHTQYLFQRGRLAAGGAADTACATPTLARENALGAAVLHNHQESIAQLIGQWFAEAAGQPQGQSDVDNALAALLRRSYATLLHSQEPALPQGAAGLDLAQYYVQAFTSLAGRYQQISFAGYPELIRKTLAYLNGHSGQEVSLADAATHLSINYSYLSYLFKKETGIGIAQYLNAVRVANAMRLMLLQDMSVSAASERAGFRQYGHFVTVFKGVTGLSPSSFRKHPQAFQYMMAFSPLKPERLADERPEVSE